jgi:hypothetical protein
MNRKITFITLSAVAFIFATAPACAASNETWVSGTGTDSGTCPITAPCATFAHALTQTLAGGSINVLSSGDFGSVTINKSVTLEARGTTAHLTGIQVSAGTNGVVVLRGLTITGSGRVGTEAIYVTSGKSLHVEDCVIRQAGAAINFVPTGGAKLSVVNTTIDESSRGITVFNQGNPVLVTVDRLNLNDSGGLHFTANDGNVSIGANVSNSVFTHNGNGIAAALRSGGPGPAGVDVTARHIALTGNQNALFTVPGATIAIDHAAFVGNIRGVFGQVLSYETNVFRANNINGTLAGTVALQ